MEWVDIIKMRNRDNSMKATHRFKVEMIILSDSNYLPLSNAIEDLIKRLLDRYNVPIENRVIGACLVVFVLSKRALIKQETCSKK